MLIFFDHYAIMMSLNRPEKYKNLQILEKTDPERFIEYCFDGELEAARELLRKYSRLNQQEDITRIVTSREPTRNGTALHCATQQGHQTLSLWLITETEVDIRAVNDVSYSKWLSLILLFYLFI